MMYILVILVYQKISIANLMNTLNMVNYVYIVDLDVSEKTYSKFTEYLKHGDLLIHATSVNKKWDSYIYKHHKNRLDVSRDVVRSEESRPENKKDSIEPENIVQRKK